MPDMFADFALPADLTAKFYPTKPGSLARLMADDGTACEIEFYGWHSKAAQDFRFSREDRLRKLGRDMTPAEAYDDLGDMLATLTVSWVLVAPTRRVLDTPCNFDTARALFNGIDHRWLRQQCIDFLNTEGNFLPASWNA